MLLYLIRRQNLDILDIPIAEITRQYMRYIELMQVLQLELAGEYLLMAATLAEVKSRMLLPRIGTDGAAEEADPRAELVRRLQEYERFKRAAEGIDHMPRLERDTWMASAELVDRKIVRIPPQVTLQEMLLAFQDVSVAQRHVRPPSRAARTLVSAPAHDGYLDLTANQRLRGFRALVYPGRGAPRRHRDLCGHPGTIARRVDRNSAIRSIRAPACAPGQSSPEPVAGADDGAANDDLARTQ